MTDYLGGGNVSRREPFGYAWWLVRRLVCPVTGRGVRVADVE
jgi:hypothetical protein